MGTLRDELISKLWTVHSSGKKPVAIRMNHRLLCRYIKEDFEFFDELDADDNGWTFQTLPIKIDSWASQTPIIESEVRSEDQRPQTTS